MSLQPGDNWGITTQHLSFQIPLTYHSRPAVDNGHGAKLATHVSSSEGQVPAEREQSAHQNPHVVNNGRSEHDDHGLQADSSSSGRGAVSRVYVPAIFRREGEGEGALQRRDRAGAEPGSGMESAESSRLGQCEGAGEVTGSAIGQGGRQVTSFSVCVFMFVCVCVCVCARARACREEDDQHKHDVGESAKALSVAETQPFPEAPDSGATYSHGSGKQSRSQAGSDGEGGGPRLPPWVGIQSAFGGGGGSIRNALAKRGWGQDLASNGSAQAHISVQHTYEEQSGRGRGSGDDGDRAANAHVSLERRANMHVIAHAHTPSQPSEGKGVVSARPPNEMMARGGEKGWGAMSDWASAQGPTPMEGLQHLHKGLHQHLQQLQQTVTLAGVAGRGGGAAELREIAAGERAEVTGDEAVEARKKAEDTKAAAQQARLERVDAIAKGYVPVKDLTDNDKRLLWRYRTRLPKFSRGLLPLFHATRWDDRAHVEAVLQLVDIWVDLETDDALELLGCAYAVAPMRQLALRSLDKIGDQELLCYLMPLAIALRYDVEDTLRTASSALEPSAPIGAGVPGGIVQGAGQRNGFGPLPSRRDVGGGAPGHTVDECATVAEECGRQSVEEDRDDAGVGLLAQFLIGRSCRNCKLATGENLFVSLSLSPSVCLFIHVCVSPFLSVYAVCLCTCSYVFTDLSVHPCHRDLQILYVARAL